MDENREAAVWQRVTAKPVSRMADPVGPLIRERGELAAAYRTLAGELSGRKQTLARKLLEEEQAAGTVLRGMAVLAGEPTELIKLWPGEKQEPRKLLKRCWQRTLRCQEEYTLRCGATELGGSFRALAEQAQSQCSRILQLLGELG